MGAGARVRGLRGRGGVEKREGGRGEASEGGSAQGAACRTHAPDAPGVSGEGGVEPGV